MPRQIVVTLLALGLPAAALGWTSGEVLPGAVLVDVTAEGLDVLAGLVPNLLPSTLAVPDVHQSGTIADLWGWGVDAGLDVTNIQVGITIDQADLAPADGYLALDANANVRINDASSQMVVHAWALSDDIWGWHPVDISVTCPVYVEPMAIGLSSDIALDVKDDQLVPYLDATVLDTDGDGRPIQWQISEVNLRGDCLLGDVFDIADGLGLDIEGLILDAFESDLNDQIQALGGEIEVALEDGFAAATVDQTVALGASEMQIAVYPDDVQIVPAGVRLSMAGSFASQTAPCVTEYAHYESIETPGGVPAIGAAPEGVEVPFHFGATLDDDLVNQALFAIYNGGALCYTLGEDSGLPVNTALLGVLSPTLAGLFPETAPLTLKTRPAAVPTATPVGPHDLNLSVPRLGVDLVGELDYRPATLLGTELDVEAGIDFTLDPTTGDLSIAVPLSGDDLHPTVLLNEFAPGEDEAIAASFGGLFDSIVGPLLGSMLEGLTFPLPSFYGLGLTRFDMVPAGPDRDLFGIYAGLGPVTYASAGCDSGGGCESGCGTTGNLPATAVLAPAALLISALRRRKS